MPEGFFDPLPEGLTSRLPIRSGKFYDIEVYGTIFAESGGISGDLAVTGDLNITGNTTIAGTLDIDGAVTLSSDMTLDGGKILTDSAGNDRIEYTDTGLRFIDSGNTERGFLNIGASAVEIGGSFTFNILNNNLGFNMGNDLGQWLTTASSTVDDGGGDYTAYLSNSVVDYGAGSFPIYEQVTATWDESTTTMLATNHLLAANTTEVGGELEVTSQDLTFSKSGAQYIDKTGSGDLYIQNDVTSGKVHMRAKDSTGTLRARFLIEGASATRFYNRAGTQMILFDTYNTDQHSIVFGASSNQRLHYDVSTSQFSFLIGGTTEFTLGTTGLVIPNVYSLGISGTTRDVYVKDDGTISYLTSRRDTKTDIRYAKELEDVELNPVLFEYKETAEPDAGFIVEDLAEQHPLLAVYDDGEPVSYNAKPILAVLAAKVNRLEERMARCNCAV